MLPVTMDTQYLCNICGKQMKNHEGYTEHMQGKHGERNKICVCGKQFSWRSAYARHVRKCTLVLSGANGQQSR